MTVFETSGALHPEDHRNIIVHRVELDKIIAHIENRDEYVVLQAPTQSGKTTLLYQIYFRLHRHGYGVVYLDLSALGGLEPDQFYPKFCTKIQDRFADLIIDNTDGTLAPDEVTNAIDFVEYLRLISEKAKGIKKLIFMIDEFGNLSKELTSTLFPSIRSIFTSGRGLSDDRDFYKKLMFIFAGALDLDKLIQGKNSPLRESCKSFSLDDFSLEQVLDLAQNLKEFPPEIIEVIAACVHQWCGGHPYLTQRLFGLIDESQGCRNASKDNLLGVIEQLVKDQIVYDNDANLIHVSHYLEDSGDSYCKSVSQILRNKPEARKKTTPHAKNLLLMGIIKRSKNQCLIIRNKLYEEALDKFFNEYRP